ncbi:TrbC family F-type conjugative pilus assembly protein [Campylobacter sp. RM12651]|uniref:TrbC family F-type conjugative pilus assembly protein n=1 Tax=Campylobacter sp. RM12651 TaxID=1660079 RepID=UPI001EFAB8CE|nr:TrbC family F-type conjugative pilus assembly protein [Campylobacter sp. RM12651]ULO03746.1 F-type type IV conjugative transfer system protein TrbC [Campylobacter sp. RM12651]
MNKYKLVLSLFLCSFLMANDNSDKNIFNKKYQQADNNVVILKNDTYNINDLKNQNLKENIDLTIDNNFIIQNKNNDIINSTQQLNNIINNENYKNNFINAKKDLLYDLNSNASSELIQKLQSYNDNTNNLLLKNERIFIVLSSSLSKELIKNYFISVSKSPQDFAFVLRGVIGNDLKKLVPTINYFKDLNTISKQGFDLSINPKIIQAYNITKVPAIVYIKNYNNILEQHEQYEDKQINSSDDNVFIFYGDMALEYALEQINKKANSQSLQTLIKKLQVSEFYK